MSRKPQSEYTLIVDSRGNPLRVVAEYEGATTTPTRRQIRTGTSADTELGRAGPQLRDNARRLEENHDLVNGVLDTLVDKTIGMELVPEPQVKLLSGAPATAVNEQICAWHERWAKHPEATGELTLGQAQRIAGRSFYRDGECFAQLLLGNVRAFNHATPVRLSFEMLESDLIPFDLYEAKDGVVQGVQKDAWGAPVSYHVLKEHPGNTVGTSFSRNLRFTLNAETKTVPARRMVHLKFMKRIRQTRGVTVLHSTMNRFRDMKDIDESERIAARVAAHMAWYVKKFAPADFEPDVEDPRQMEIEEGTIFDELRPGEEIGAFESRRPNPDLDGFRSYQLRNVAAGVGTGYSPVARSWEGSWSSQRMEQSDMRAHYGILFRNFVDMWEIPIYEAFAAQLFSAGLIRGVRSVDQSTILDVAYTQPETPYVNPLQGIEADLKELGGNEYGIPLNTWENIVRRRGGNPARLLQQLEVQPELITRIRVQQNEQVDTEPQSGNEEETRARVVSFNRNAG